MRSTRLTSTITAALVLTGSVVTAPAALAQDPTPAPSCALVSPDEVNSIFSGAGLSFNDNSRAYYCSFGGAFTLTLSVMTETTLEETKADFGEGVDAEAAGHPAWWQESSGNFAVAANGSVVLMNGWDSADSSDEQRALLTALAELVVGRVPAASDPDVVARLKALLAPATGGDPAAVSTAPGWYLGIGDPVTPEASALLDLLAAQGRSPADLVIAFGSNGSDAFVTAVEAPGLEGSELLLPLYQAIAPTSTDAPISTVDLGGKQVTLIGTEPPTYAIASGGAAIYANGPDAFLEDFFSTLP